MDPLSLTFIISAFIAGIITFLAPCTLPLIPGYLSFISGASISDLQDPAKVKKVRVKIFLNGVFYVIGFSAVFILFGSLISLGGSLFSDFRLPLIRLGGVFVAFFGLFLLAPAITSLTNNRINLLKIPPFSLLAGEHQPRFTRKLKPGNPFSSLVFGGSFALGWSPCVGPILAAILTLAASSATVGQGTFLLFVFSLGLAIPFLLTALGIGWASTHFAKIGKYLNWVSAIGGVFLIIFGVIMATNNFLVWISLTYRFFNFLGIDFEGTFLQLL